MSENALALKCDLNNLPVQMGADADYTELAKGGDFLARLQLYGKGKHIDRGDIERGHYGIAEGDEIIDLGDVIDVIPFARRPKAMDMSDADNLIIVYDNATDEFKRIAAASVGQDSGCMYGVSFLLYERNSGRFLEFFCGTKSTRSEAKKLFPYLPLTAADVKSRGLDEEPHGPLPLTLKSKLVEKGKWTWWVPVCVKCSVPFKKVPTNEQIIKEITRFVNPSKEGPEKVEEPAGRKGRAR